jgi:hypothetical protein
MVASMKTEYLCICVSWDGLSTYFKAKASSEKSALAVAKVHASKINVQFSQIYIVPIEDIPFVEEGE